MITIRLRSVTWFAAGIVIALVAVTVFAGLRTTAASPDQETSFTPITPCRLFDTRPAPDNVGPRNTPLGTDDSYTQQVTGANGDCTIPAEAVGISLNVTAVNPTAASFITVYPADAPLPLASNINVSAGQSPTPNKVDVKLSTAGAIALYNKFGTVDVLADVVGYYTPTGLEQIQTQLDRLNAIVMPTPLGHLTLSGVDFIPTAFTQRTQGGLGSSEWFNVWARTTGDRLTTDSYPLNDRCLIAPAHLPQGALVIAMRFVVEDTNSASDAAPKMELYRDTPSGNLELLAATDTSTDTGVNVLTATVINHVVNNATGTYLLYTCGYQANVRLHQVQLDYLYAGFQLTPL